MSIQDLEQTGQVGMGSMPDLPLLGHRNYWYPALSSNEVGSRPVAVRLLGEDIAVFRSGRTLGAIADRCPHRGARLSLGRALFPGTLSCGYHGWTFDAGGNCLAAVVEGPDSQLPGKASVKSYPITERFGIIWIFVGDMEPPPLEEDLPPQLFRQHVMTQFIFEEWRCNWRNITENYPDMLHATWVHRRSLIMLFQKIPAWGRVAFEPLADGKGIHVEMKGGGLQAHFPGLGTFPAKSWWRVLTRRTSERGTPAEVRMPGYIILTKREPYLGFPLLDLQWPVPIDENRTKVLLLNINYPQTPRQRLLLRLWYEIYYKLIHLQFVNQDRKLIEGETYRNPEKLSASDRALIYWRRLAARAARQPRLPERLVDLNGSANGGVHSPGDGADAIEPAGRPPVVTP